jgi:hypothetical protein
VGAAGTAGALGKDGTNGDNIATLTGGTLGDVVGGDAEIQLSGDNGPNSPLYMAPGNGADRVQGTVQVPTPGGTAHRLQVQLYVAPGVPGGPGTGAQYMFVVCNGENCDPTGVACTITDPATTCPPETDTGVDFLPGDSISILAFNWPAGDPVAVDVSWSLDFALASPI